MKLLVVEDENKTANTLKKGLEEKGYQVQIAYDGETAYMLSLRNKFDLIVTDVVMPKLNGVEFCRKLRENQNFTPVIMLTALGLSVEKIKGFEAGSDDYMVKPFEFEELLARIKVHLNRNKKLHEQADILQYADLTVNFIT